MKPRLHAPALLLLGIASGAGMAATAEAGQIVGSRPRIEVGARAAAVAEFDDPGVLGGASVTFNVDPRTAIEASVDFRPDRKSSFSVIRRRLAYVQLKQTLYASRTGRFSGTLGIVAGTDRESQLPFTYTTFNGQPVTIPGRTFTRGMGGAMFGVGYDRVLAARLAVDAQTQFIVTAYTPIVRAVFGVSVPFGRFSVRPERATPTLAAFSEVDAGQTAWVTMADGRRWKGTITDMSTTTIELARAGVTTSLALADVRKIEAPDRITDGAKRGAYIGLTVGVPVLIAGGALCKNEGGSGCGGFVIASAAVWSGIGAGLGALIGAISDSLHEGRRVVYEAGKSTLTVTPIAARHGAGLGAVIRW